LKGIKRSGKGCRIEIKMVQNQGQRRCNGELVIDDKDARPFLRLNIECLSLVGFVNGRSRSFAPALGLGPGSLQVRAAPIIAMFANCEAIRGSLQGLDSRRCLPYLNIGGARSSLPAPWNRGPVRFGRPMSKSQTSHHRLPALLASVGEPLGVILVNLE
jgi:hypothetical protein